MTGFTARNADGTISRYEFKDGMVYKTLHDPSVAETMRFNAEMRKNPGAVKTTTFGKIEMNIPPSHLKMLDKFFPGISNPAHPDYRWQMRRFMASPVSAPYRLQDPKRLNAGHIVVK